MTISVTIKRGADSIDKDLIVSHMDVAWSPGEAEPDSRIAHHVRLEPGQEIECHIWDGRGIVLTEVAKGEPFKND
jgi:hypothetical protein